jgi:hypothetical protein
MCCIALNPSGDAAVAIHMAIVAVVILFTLPPNACKTPLMRAQTMLLLQVDVTCADLLPFSSDVLMSSFQEQQNQHWRLQYSN